MRQPADLSNGASRGRLAAAEPLQVRDLPLAFRNVDGILTRYCCGADCGGRSPQLGKDFLQAENLTSSALPD